MSGQCADGTDVPLACDGPGDRYCILHDIDPCVGLGDAYCEIYAGYGPEFASRRATVVITTSFAFDQTGTFLF